MHELADYEAMATILESTDDYRVLKRLKPRNIINEPDTTSTRLGIFLDLETTGLDPAVDEIIEFAMLPFSYSLEGKIFEVKEPLQGLRQPGIPLSEEITSLTGITSEMLLGQSIDPAEIEAFIEPASVIVAHNAGFDRKFAERFTRAFESKPWACSMTQIPWQAEGLEGTKLAYLVSRYGLFYDAHRATDDCHAGIELLSRPLPKSGVLAFARLLQTARETTCRIWAENSPYESKDALKARGYRWNGEARGKPRSWYFDLPEDRVAEELAYLHEQIFRGDAAIPVTRITARERFSDRC